MKHRAPLIGVLVAVVLAAGYWFLLYKPALDEQAAHEAQTLELVEQQSQLRNELARLEEVRRDEDTYRAALARAEKFIPTGVAQPAVVDQLQRTADAAGVEITSVSFGEPTVVEGAPDTGDAETTLASISVSMVVEGRYFDTVDFFRRVEHDMPRAVLTSSVHLAEGEEKFPSLATTWGGNIFAVVPAAATVAADDPSAAPDGTEQGADAEGASADAEGAGGAPDTAAASPSEEETP